MIRQDPLPVAGFTLIEMMVVVGIVAILALMMLPSYQDKLIRDQIAEALPLADVAKPPVAAAWAATQTFPANAGAGLPPADKIVSNSSARRPSRAARSISRSAIARTGRSRARFSRFVRRSWRTRR